MSLSINFGQFATETMNANDKKMNFIELFSGSSDISNKIRANGGNAFDIDWDEKTPAAIHADILLLNLDDLKNLFPNKKIDFIWASPDCATYSRANTKARTWFPDFKPLTEYAVYCDKVNYHLWNDILIPFSKEGGKYIVENPCGRYRHMPFSKNSPFLVNVHYSDFGGETNKPTDLFTNCFGLSSFLQAKRINKKNHIEEKTRGCISRSKIPSYLVSAISDFIFTR